MKACQKMRSMRIDPYPDAIIRRGLLRKEPKENANPILEEVMMYSAVVGVEMLSGMADIIDTMDGMVLEQSERKAEVDRAIVQLHHSLGRRDERMTIVEDWQRDATKHM